MKPIIGEVVSSTPVSLAEVASILSNFISKGTGVTQEMLAYLARTRSAFDELLEYHRCAKPLSGASRLDDAMEEVEKQSLMDKTAHPVARSDYNGHVERTRDSEGMVGEKINKEKRRKHQEYEVDLGLLERPARSKLDATPQANGAKDSCKAEEPEGRYIGKKKKRRERQEEGGASNKSISDVDIEQPPKKKKKKEKAVEYEVEVERNLQCH